MSSEKHIRDEQLQKAKAAAQGREAGYAGKRHASGSDAGVEGEGSYTAARSYREGVEKTMKSGKVEEKAEEAKRAYEGPQGDMLREAERRGQQAARMEDPALRRKAKQQG